MIPRDYITEWRAHAPWVEDFQIEQDLVISRVLIAIYTHPILADSLAFRGGTALYKLHIHPPARYSEDIDLVQVNAGSAGPMMTALREVLDPWLGNPQWKQNRGRVTFTYAFESEDTPARTLKVKVEINTREHFTVYGFLRLPYNVTSRWFEGRGVIKTYSLDELVATKLRALYQRRKGRDLFDLSVALGESDLDVDRVITAFSKYMAHGGNAVTRAEFERNFVKKLQNPQFSTDIGPLLAAEFSWNYEDAADRVRNQLIVRLP